MRTRSETPGAEATTGAAGAAPAASTACTAAETSWEAATAATSGAGAPVAGTAEAAAEAAKSTVHAQLPQRSFIHRPAPQSSAPASAGPPWLGLPAASLATIAAITFSIPGGVTVLLLCGCPLVFLIVFLLSIFFSPFLLAPFLLLIILLLGLFRSAGAGQMLLQPDSAPPLLQVQREANLRELSGGLRVAADPDAAAAAANAIIVEKFAFGAAIHQGGLGQIQILCGREVNFVSRFLQYFFDKRRRFCQNFVLIFV